MSTPTPEPASEDGASRAAIDAVYRANYDVMRYLAGRKFKIPQDEIRPLIHEVFVAYIEYRDRVRNDRAWLVAATCNACRDYWTARGRHDARIVREDFLGSSEPADLGRHLDLRDVLWGLRPRDRELLRLRFIEGYTSKELADRLDTTVPYAKKLVHESVARARRLMEARRGASR